MYDFREKVAVITGGGSGIGRGVAVRLAADNCRIVIVDRNRETMAETVEIITRTGGDCRMIPADVRSFEDMSEVARRVRQDAGRIDILVNNAGILRMGSITEMSTDDWDHTFSVNVGGTFRCTKAFMPGMMAHRSGAIVNMASWFGKIGKADFAAYCASKFAVIGLTQAAAMEAAPFGVRVNAVCPGTIVGTEMRSVADAGARSRGQPTAADREKLIPLGRAGQPRDIARVVAFLASDEASYMTGQAVNVTGGLWLS